METKTTFGLGSIAKSPPKWVVPTLTIIILVIGTASITISGDPAIASDLKLRINNYLDGLAMLVTGLASMVGKELKLKKLN